MFTGVQLVQESLGELGTLPVVTLTLRIPYPSSGVVTLVKNMLLLMNFVEASRFLMFSDGWTDIQSTWRLKARPCPCEQPSCGSQAMSDLNSGIQI